MFEASREARRHFDQLKMLDVAVRVGEYELQLSLPHETKVEELLRIVEGYESIHREYGP